MSEHFTKEQKEQVYINLGVDIFDRPPEGYTPIEEALSKPLGMTWYTNGKSLESGEKKNILVRYPDREEE